MIVVSGPGGVGKGTIVDALVRRDPRLWLSRSWTTRQQRPGERDDAYVYTDRAAFERRISEGGFLEWTEFMKKWYPSGSLVQGENGYAYAVANLMAHVLKQAGDDLTRTNIMKQAANVKGLQLPMVQAGIKVNTSPTDFAPISQVQLQKFKGETWELFGEILSGDVGG